MSYFKKLPNILYQSPLPDRSSTGDLIEIKNIFRRSKLYDYLKDNVHYLISILLKMVIDLIRLHRNYMVVQDMILL